MTDRPGANGRAPQGGGGVWQGGLGRSPAPCPRPAPHPAGARDRGAWSLDPSACGTERILGDLSTRAPELSGV